MTPEEEISALKSQIIDIQKILIKHTELLGVFEQFCIQTKDRLDEIDGIEETAHDEAGYPIIKLETPMEKKPVSPQIVFAEEELSEEERMYV